MTQTITLKLGDSFEEIPKLKGIGAVVCDPPYLISFMNKKWDDTEGENEEWFKGWLTECFDILPSGGVVKVFSATRTFHRLCMAMEAANFQDVRLETWCYGSGFPKSMNVSKKLEESQSPEAARFEGWGTALKPAWEPFIVGVKP